MSEYHITATTETSAYMHIIFMSLNFTVFALRT
jgi:hypothetical protein